MSGNTKVAKMRLQLEDMITGPALKIGKSLAQTNRELKGFGKDAAPAFSKLQAELDRLQKKSAAIAGFREAKQGVKFLGISLDEARSKFEALRKRFAENPAKGLESQMKAARKEMMATARELREQAGAAKVAENALHGYGSSVKTLRADSISTESAIRRLSERLTGFRQHAGGNGLPVVEDGGDGVSLPVVPEGEEPHPTGRNGGKRAGFFQRNGGKLVAAAGAYVGVQSLYNGAKQAMTGYAEQDRRLSRVMITADADMTRKGSALRQISAIAMKTGMPLDAIMGALETQVSQGESLDSALRGLAPIAITAQASGADASDIASTLYGVRHSLKVPDSEIQGAFDRLNAGGKIGSFEAPDAAKYLPAILPQAAALGYKGNDGLARLVAALQVVRARSGDSSSAATNLENVLAKLYQKETANKFADFGIDLPGLLDAARKNGGDPLSVVMAATREATGGDLSKLPLLFEDTQAQAGVRALIQGADDLEKFTQQLGNVDGSTLQDFGKIAGDTASKLENLNTSFDRLTTSIGATVATLANPGLKWLADQSQASDDATSGYESQKPEDRNRNRQAFMKRWSAAHPNAWPWEGNSAYQAALGRLGRGEGGLFDGLPAVPEPVTAKPLTGDVLEAMRRAQMDLGNEHWESGLQRVGRGLAPAPADPRAVPAPAGGPASISVPISLSVSVSGQTADQVKQQIEKTAMPAIQELAAKLSAALGGLFRSDGPSLNHQINRSKQTTMTGGERF